MTIKFTAHLFRVASIVVLVGGYDVGLAATPKQPKSAASFYLDPHPQRGQSLSDIAYRVISFYGPDMDDNTVQIPAIATDTFAAGDTDDDIKFTTSVRMDGRQVIPSIAGDFRENGTTQCYQGRCSLTSDASGPFYNRTFWGNPQGKIKPGEKWTVAIKQPWQLGPPGTQTVTVVSVDAANGMVVLKHEGEGTGSFEGAATTLNMKKDGHSHPVTVKYGKAHWVEQAIFQHGVVVSDELSCNTDVELSSSEVGTVVAHRRQYMSLLQHPEPIAN